MLLLVHKQVRTEQSQEKCHEAMEMEVTRAERTNGCEKELQWRPGLQGLRSHRDPLRVGQMCQGRGSLGDSGLRYTGQPGDAT